MLKITGGFSFEPQFFPAAAKVGSFSAGNCLFNCFPVHIGHHKHVFVRNILDNCGNQPTGVKFEAVDKCLYTLCQNPFTLPKFCSKSFSLFYLIPSARSMVVLFFYTGRFPSLSSSAPVLPELKMTTGGKERWSYVQMLNLVLFQATKTGDLSYPPDQGVFGVSPGEIFIVIRHFFRKMMDLFLHAVQVHQLLF